MVSADRCSCPHFFLRSISVPVYVACAIEEYVSMQNLYGLIWRVNHLKSCEKQRKRFFLRKKEKI